MLTPLVVAVTEFMRSPFHCGYSGNCGSTQTLPVTTTTKLCVALRGGEPLSVTLTATLIDSAGNPIVDQDVTFGGTVPGLTSGRTNTSGQVAVTFAAPTTPNVYTINATASGTTSADLQLTVFSSTIPSAVIPAGVTPSLYEGQG